MRQLWRRIRQRIANRFLRDRVVFARTTILRRGEYVPRGSNGRVAWVMPDGCYQVVFYGEREVCLPVRPTEVEFSPMLRAGRAGRLTRLFGSRLSRRT
jgi:hypothetical protein